MDLIRRLHRAIQNKDQTAIQAAVMAGADMDHIWGMQGTALCQAIGTGCVSTVSLLLELGCDVNGEDYDGGFPLSLAICKRHSAIALLLISHPSCDLNALDPVSKQRPLCSAVTEGLSDVVEALVQNPRCNITQRNNIGNSALHLALLHKQDHITKILARCEGFRFLSNLAGNAPLHIVATLGDCNSLSLLYPTPTRTEEALHSSQLAGKEESSLTPSPSSTMAALKRELDQRVMYSGDTALHLAVREKHDDMARRLMALGAAVNLQNNSGQTALLLACAANNTDLVIEMLKNGAPPNVAGHLRLQQRTLLGAHSRESSLTPLHIAASTSNLQMVQALCEFGADPNSWDERGRSALYVALLNKAGDVALYLLTQTAQTLTTCLSTGGPSLLHAVCQCESHAAEITTVLLERGCSLYKPNHLSNLPLHEALCWENADIVQVMLQYGADPNAPGELHTVPLAFAARTGNILVGQMLLAAGANVNGGDLEVMNVSNFDGESDEETDEEEKWSPLREALEAGMVDFACFLVNAGCNLSREKYLYTLTSISHHRRVAGMELEDSDDDDDDDDDDDASIPDALKDNEKLFKWLRDQASHPHSLLQLSLEAVRNVFQHGDPPFPLMAALPLPEKVIAKLFYKDSV